MTAVRLFLTKVKSLPTDEDKYWQDIEGMVEVIAHEYEKSAFDSITQLHCVRGLLLLMLNE